MTQKIYIQLTEQDVRKDSYSILHDMHTIRLENLAERELHHQDEYSSLAYRLATCFKGLYQPKGDTTVAALDIVVNAEPSLSAYDRLQINHWKKHSAGKTFIQNLASLTVDFFSPTDYAPLFEQDAEYHLWQALELLNKNTAVPMRSKKCDLSRLFVRGGEVSSVFRDENHLPINDFREILEGLRDEGYTEARFQTDPQGMQQIQNTQYKLKDIQAGYWIREGGRRDYFVRVSVLFPAPSTNDFLHIAFGGLKHGKTNQG